MVEIQPEVIDIASLGETPVITLSKSDAGSDAVHIENLRGAANLQSISEVASNFS